MQLISYYFLFLLIYTFKLILSLLNESNPPLRSLIIITFIIAQKKVAHGRGINI